ncbi:MAG: glycosyltransferase [Bacteroidales bacterium]|nr:glycosyltransferase [Bacteroidales bacterium]
MIQNWFSPENLYFQLFIGYMVSVAVLMLYYFGLFSRLAFYRMSESPLHNEPVSVVICARNEYQNLQDNLPLFLSQDYPQFEIVVVNDASQDDTYFLLKVLSDQHENLKVVNIEKEINFFKGKKFPLSIGIKSASHDILLLTDADCIPASDQWIREMTSAYQNKDTSVVLAYGAYKTVTGFLNKIIRYETVVSAMMYLSMARAGIPYMGVGRNLSYRKSLFYSNKGFISHYGIASGDDDLFINKVANSKNTAVMIAPQSFTYSEPKKSFEEWFRQKRRHLTTSGYYKFKHQLLLGAYVFFQYTFYGLFTLLLVLKYPWQPLVIFFGIKFFIYLFIFKKSMLKLKERNLLLFSPLLEIVFLFIYPTISLANLFGKENKWR